MLKVSYWNNCGALQDSYLRLATTLIPNSGDCSTLEGELLRAVSKVYHDYYNNGFGNDMRGPVAFLMAKYQVDEFKSFYEDLVEAAPENRGDDGLDEQQLEDLVTSVISHVDSKAGNYQPLDAGMWTYRDRIAEPEDEYEEDTWDSEED